MRLRERILMQITVVLLALVGLFFCQSATGQGLDMPAHLSRDPGYWYHRWQSEQVRAVGLQQWGTKAISGLQSSLNVANDTIQARTIQRDTWKDRAVKAETSLAVCEADKPKTWAGRQIQKLAKPFQWIGIGTTAVLILKATLP